MLHDPYQKKLAHARARTPRRNVGTPAGGGVAPGRSQLWNGGGDRPAAGARARSSAEAFGGDSDSGDENDEGELGSAVGTPSDLDLDSLVLASQTSTGASVSSPSRPSHGGAAASVGGARGARRARGSSSPGDESGGRAADVNESDVYDFGLVDDSSEDDFSICKDGGGDGIGAGGGASSSSTSRGTLPNDGGGDSAVGPRQEKALAKKEATAKRKRQREVVCLCVCARVLVSVLVCVCGGRYCCFFVFVLCVLTSESVQGLISAPPVVSSYFVFALAS